MSLGKTPLMFYSGEKSNQVLCDVIPQGHFLEETFSEDLQDI